MSTDNIEADNPDVSVLNHEEQNQEMKDLLVFDPIRMKKRKPGTGSTLRKSRPSRWKRKLSIQMGYYRMGLEKWRNCYRKEFAGHVRSAWLTSKSL
jgi:hypothetical protein